MKHVLTIAGSDCSGGAGIQADLKTFATHGVYGMSVIVSVVAENTFRVIGVEDISPSMIANQLDAVFEDISVDAVKIGMLSTRSTMEAVAAKLDRFQPQNIVVDPVMVAKNGFALMSADVVDSLIALILPYADILTPNIPEAEVLTGMHIETLADMQESAERIADLGPKAVLVKGGHRIEDATDLFYDGTTFFQFPAERIDTKNTHGTGCTYSSAIAANLARGMEPYDAIKAAKDYVTMAIRHSLSIGKGCGPTHHFYNLYKNGLAD